jgi:non-heme chloroperoxidase
MQMRRDTTDSTQDAKAHGSACDVTRRDVLVGSAAMLVATALASTAQAEHTKAGPAVPHHTGDMGMSTVTTKDGVSIFYKDWGSGPPIVFSHGWPLTADDWDAQMMFFLANGFRVIAHDRRGHGRSSQVSSGHDMDHYADDLATLTEHLNLKGAVHIGHSTGGGEVARYIGRHGESRVSKAVLISSVPPIMVKTPNNPGGLAKEVFDGFQVQVAEHRAQFYLDLPTGPFYGFNRPGVKPVQAVIQNWWRQGMMGGIKAHYDCIKVFSETEFYDDLKAVDVPVLVMHSKDDQIAPYSVTAARAIKLLKKGTLKEYADYPHGMPTTHADQINADILQFIKS